MGFEPEFDAGKPSREAVSMALEAVGIKKPEKCLLIGDHLETDILAARNMGIDSVLVLTGVSKEEDIDKTNIKPTFIIKKISEINRILDK